MPKSQPEPSWGVVESPKPDANAKRPPPPVDDAVRAHAEWFAWAKRHKADFGRAHGAARKAVAASEQGMPPDDVEKAAREAIAAGDTTPVDETRQAYSAWFAVAAVDMGMERARAHAFAQAGYAAQREGADVKTATNMAEAAVAPATPTPPSPPATVDPSSLSTEPLAARPGTFPPQPPADLGDWGPPPGAPPPPLTAAPPPPPVSELPAWSPPTPFIPPPPAEPTPTVETPSWSPPTSPPPSAGPPPAWPPPPTTPPPPPPPPAPPADTGAWKPPTTFTPPLPPQHEPVAPITPPTPATPATPAVTRQSAIDKAVADTKLIAVTRSAAKLVPYGEVKKTGRRSLLSDTLPPEVQIWVVAVAGTLTSLAEPAVGHAVAYLAADQHAGIGYDIHTGTGWPAWFDELPDRATD